MTTIGDLKPIHATGSVPKLENAGEYDGPPPNWLIEHHKLAHQIIACHSVEPMQVLDAPSLALLRRFIENPGRIKDILEELDMQDKEGDKPGTRANRKYGSLVGYVIASEGFDEEEWKLLREWFDSGVVDEDIKGVVPHGSGRDVMPGWNGD